VSHKENLKWDSGDWSSGDRLSTKRILSKSYLLEFKGLGVFRNILTKICKNCIFNSYILTIMAVALYNNICGKDGLLLYKYIRNEFKKL